MKNDLKETPASVYLMHKYWGKKPSKDLREIINKYTVKNSSILDPFAGYGGIGVEGILLDRNVILNDLNPMASFIEKNVLESSIDMNMLNEDFENIKLQYQTKEKEWYEFNGKKIITILRDNNDNLIKLKLYNEVDRKTVEYKLNLLEAQKLKKDEDGYEIKEWYPQDIMIRNSRISVKESLRVSDLFSKRELICQSYLYMLIDNLKDSKEKELLKFAFTSNLANCSKLVPPIKSRGEMAQGAWMTGFYVGDRYLENNVFHYFENRIKKIMKGKKDYINLIKEKNSVNTYKIMNNDVKKLRIEDESIDFVFTDFPYGDTVPYFEQSQMWNSWLKFKVDYKNEIVVSNSCERNKNEENFSKDIRKAVNEIKRVLKDKSYFVFTFHSLSGSEWEAISNTLVENKFEFIDCKLLLQKTFTPRQLNRKFTIKGDLLVVYRKNKEREEKKIELENLQEIIKKEILKECKIQNLYDTNDLITLCVKCLLKYNYISQSLDFAEIIKKYFDIDKNDERKWRLKDGI